MFRSLVPVARSAMRTSSARMTTTNAFNALRVVTPMLRTPALSAPTFSHSGPVNMNLSVSRMFSALAADQAMTDLSNDGDDPVKAPAASSSGARESGTVKWFDSQKGFGFIVRDSGGDLFVHFTAISGKGYRSLEEGQRVEFTVGQGKKGPSAMDVMPARS